MTTTTSKYQGYAVGAISSKTGNKLLSLAEKIWFIVAAAGQLIFFVYIVLFYGGSAIQGKFSEWNKTLSHGIIEGDPMGNISMVLHLLLAAVITFGGVVQLIPAVRNKLPRLHRIVGKTYIVAAYLISFGAFHLLIARGPFVGSNILSVGLSGNAILMIVFATLALRFALQKQFAKHQKWALRLFIVASGVWFYRIMFMLWVLIHQGAPGHTDAMDGPFDITMSFASYLLPLAICELYFRARAHRNNAVKNVYAISLMVLTLLMASGIGMAALVLWFPNMF